ncbi:MAG: hypothetical protein AB1679_28315 [Actinomycetota bacterium]|jgi:hypothetical protein
MRKNRKVLLGVIGLAVVVPAGIAGAVSLRDPELRPVVAGDKFEITCDGGASGGVGGASGGGNGSGNGTGRATGFFKTTRNLLAGELDTLFAKPGVDAVDVKLDGQLVVRLLKNETFYTNPTDFPFPCDQDTLTFTFQAVDGNTPVGDPVQAEIEVDSVVGPSS